MENQPKLETCVLGTKGVDDYEGPSAGFARTREISGPAWGGRPSFGVPVPLPCLSAWRVSCERRSIKRQQATAYANRGLKSLRETKKLRVCIAEDAETQRAAENCLNAWHHQHRCQYWVEGEGESRIAGLSEDTMAKGCPVCGCRKYMSGRVNRSATLIVKPRVCAKCYHQYVVPLPRWIGLIAYIGAAFVVAGMLIDWFAPPEDLQLSLTWRGRMAILVVAGALILMGTQVLKGKTGYE